MSQVVSDNRPEEQVVPPESGTSEFGYRPVPVLAPVSAFLGLLSAMGFVSALGLAIGLMGIVLGAITTRKIRRSEGEYGGGWLAVTGLSLSLVFFSCGLSWLVYEYKHEVPEGFTRVNFSREIAYKGFVFQNGRNGIHPDVQPLNEKKIFLKGYMYPTGQTEGLTSFIMVKDNQQCCFGGQPALTDMIFVRMDEGTTADFSPGLVSVAGVFHTGDPSAGGQLQPVYMLEASHFSRARTSF